MNDQHSIKGNGVLRHKIPATNTNVNRLGMSHFDSKNSAMKLNDLKGNTGKAEFKHNSGLSVPRLVEGGGLKGKIKGGGIFIPKTQDFENCGDGRSISALERELAETKIKLADSETTNDVYLKQILSTKK
eukprot:XP_763157.1 hypothetical protein [Theileria parva strain Muguga]